MQDYSETQPAGLKGLWHAKTARLNAADQWFGALGLRLILGYEFFTAGLTKFRGNNWFGNIQSDFPWPFSVVPADLSWAMATWFELIGGIALMLGLFTRFFAFSLMVLTTVAVYAVHWPEQWGSLAELWQGYAISNEGQGNYKLPLLYFVMLLPLVLGGPGKLSVDHLLAGLRGTRALPICDGLAAALGLAVFAVPLLFVLPWPSAIILLIAGIIAASSLLRKKRD